MALSFVSCTKEEDSAKEQDRVPVQLGIRNMKSKADAVESLQMLEGAKLGLLAVGDFNRPDPILYNGTAEFAGEGASMSVSFPDYEDGMLYYPVMSDNNYSFYACCFGAVDMEYSFYRTQTGDMKIRVPKDVYGKQDILWALPAVASEYDGVKGYNSRYIRMLQETAMYGLLPNLEFTHVTSAIRFKLSVEDQQMQDKGFMVVSTSIRNVSNAADLDVFSGAMQDNTKAATLEYLHQTFQPTVGGVFMKDGFFIAPGAYPHLAFEFRFKTRSDAPSSVVTIDTQQILEYMKMDSIVLEKGKRYNFEVLFKKDGHNAVFVPHSDQSE